MENIESVVKILNNKKGENIAAYDVSSSSDLWDYFVMCSGTSSTHIKTLFDNIDKELKKEGGCVMHRDAGSEYNWVILDTGDVLVHIFDKETRGYYALEKIWGEKEVNISKWLRGN